MDEKMLRNIFREELQPLTSKVDLIVTGLKSVGVITEEEFGHIHRDEIPDSWLKVVKDDRQEM